MPSEAWTITPASMTWSDMTLKVTAGALWLPWTPPGGEWDLWHWGWEHRGIQVNCDWSKISTHCFCVFFLFLAEFCVCSGGQRRRGLTLQRGALQSTPEQMDGGLRDGTTTGWKWSQQIERLPLCSWWGNKKRTKRKKHIRKLVFVKLNLILFPQKFCTNIYIYRQRESES